MEQFPHKKLTYSQVQEIIFEHTQQIEQKNATIRCKDSSRDEQFNRQKRPKRLLKTISKFFKK